MSDRSPAHLCLLGDATSVHVQRWAREMLARGWRVSLVTARPEPIDGVEQVVLPPVRRSADWLLRTGAARATAGSGWSWPPARGSSMRVGPHTLF